MSAGKWVMVGSCGLDEQGLASAMHQQLHAAERAWAAFLQKHAAIAMVCCKRNWRTRADYQQGEI